MVIEEILESKSNFYAILYSHEYYLKLNGEIYEIYSSNYKKQISNSVLTTWGKSNFRTCVSKGKFKFLSFEKRSNLTW